MNLFGSGFSDNSSVTICGKPCKVVRSSVSNLVCIIPGSNDTNTASLDCKVITSENNQTIENSFTYKLSLTPRVNNISPLRGGTGGGTSITISGSGFPTNTSLVKVTIAGTECLVTSLSVTQIICQSEPYTKSSIKADVYVEILNNGLALNVSNHTVVKLIIEKKIKD